MIKYQGISTLEVLQDAKKYNQWIAEQIKPHITSPALEIGAGTGNLSKYFLATKRLYISDIDSGLVKHLKKKFAQEKNVSVTVLDIAKKPKKEYQSLFSTVFAVNVLEHIEHDVDALRNIHMLLKKKGKLILLVPAKQKAYTKLDKELGHYRRYEKSELITKIEESGYTIDTLYFFNFVGLISWYIRDKVKRKSINLKPYQIRIFDNIVPFLKIIESRLKIPVGISLIVIARKV